MITIRITPAVTMSHYQPRALYFSIDIQSNGLNLYGEYTLSLYGKKAIQIMDRIRRGDARKLLELSLDGIPSKTTLQEEIFKYFNELDAYIGRNYLRTAVHMSQIIVNDYTDYLKDSVIHTHLNEESFIWN